MSGKLFQLTPNDVTIDDEGRVIVHNEELAAQIKAAAARTIVVVPIPRPIITAVGVIL